jgi:hypothetical protein
MTEAEWLALDEREIRRLVGSLTPRRQRLLAVAACRVLDKWIDYPAAHAALETVERFADTGKTKSALRAARRSVEATRNEQFSPSSGQNRSIDGSVELALFVVQVAASENAVVGTIPQALQALVIAEGIPEESARRRMFAPVQDVIGVPGGRVALHPSWQTSAAVSLAEGMYMSRDFSAMPILGDVLERSRL